MPIHYIDDEEDFIIDADRRKRRAETPSTRAPRISSSKRDFRKPAANVSYVIPPLPRSSSSGSIRKEVVVKKEVPVLVHTQLHNALDTANPHTRKILPTPSVRTAPVPPSKSGQRIYFADPEPAPSSISLGSPSQVPAVPIVTGLSGRAVQRATAGLSVAWHDDPAISQQFRNVLTRGQFLRENIGSRAVWSATDLINVKPEDCDLCTAIKCAKHTDRTYRKALFFPYDKLFPTWKNVFAIIANAEIRLCKIDDDLGIQHISSALDSTANRTNLPAPKRNEREEFLSIAWTFAWWLNDDPMDPIHGTPLLLAAGATGVVKIYRSQQLTFFRALVGHGGPIHSVAVSPKEPWLVVTASHDRTLRIWNLLLDDQPCVAILAGLGGHLKEVTAVCWHPTLNIIASGGVDRYIKVWAVPESIYQDGVKPQSASESDSNVRTGKIKPSRRAVLVHHPICSTNYIAWDHIEQLEWFDEMRLLTKARFGRIQKDFGRRTGSSTEVVLWQFDLLKELVSGTLPPVKDDLGILGSTTTEGAFRFLKRFVIPKQGFWGDAMSFDGIDSIVLPFKGGLWECNVSKAPRRWGVISKLPGIDPADLDLPRLHGQHTAEWEEIAPAPAPYSFRATLSAAYSPEAEYIVTCGEGGMIVCWRRLDAEDLEA